MHDWVKPLHCSGKGEEVGMHLEEADYPIVGKAEVRACPIEPVKY